MDTPLDFSTGSDEECAYSRSQSSDTSDPDDANFGSLWDDTSGTSPYDVSNMEAYLYYFGLRGLKRRGPKLIFRTSKDIFKMPSGPEQDVRTMQLLPVYERHHEKICKEHIWNAIRSKVCCDPFKVH